MTNRIFFIVALVLAAGAANAEAIRINGCAELARVVYDEVQSNALYGPGQSGPWYISAGEGAIHECRTTSETVSRAFTHAMQSAGYTVSWRGAKPDAGNYCYSHYISQCDPYGGGFLPTDPVPGLTHKAWFVVSQSVMREMANPHSSDVVRFRSNDLRLRIGLALRGIWSERHAN